GLGDHGGRADAVDVPGAYTGVVGVEAARVGDDQLSGYTSVEQVLSHRLRFVVGCRVITGDQQHVDLAPPEQLVTKIETCAEEAGRRAVRMDQCPEHQTDRCVRNVVDGVQVTI